MPRLGFLYVIGDKDRVKIGTSKTPVERVKSIKMTAGTISARHWVSKETVDPYKVEAECHRRVEAMGGKLCGGEWFIFDYESAISIVNFLLNSDGVERARVIDNKSESDTMETIRKSASAFKKEVNSADLIADTMELINICEDDSLVDRLMGAGDNQAEILLVRCSALIDVLNQTNDICGIERINKKF